MHEWAIAEELLEQACNRAREGGIVRISQIEVCLGEDSHLTEEALRTSFDLLKKGTMAREAVLKVDAGDGRSLLLVSIQGEAAE